MKNTVVATTTPSGTAVSRSRMTAVQSVYIAAGRTLVHHSSRPAEGRSPACAAVRSLGSAAARCLGPAVLLLGLFGSPLLLPAAARADVRFDNCVTGSDGSVTCDTRPEGNTLMDDEAARFGLLDGGNPGWPEFDPVGDGGMGDGFGDGIWP